MVQHLIMIDLVYTNQIDHIKTSIEIGQIWVKVSMILDLNKYIFLIKVFYFKYFWLHPFGGLHKLQFEIVQKTPYGMWSCFTCISSNESLSLEFNNYFYKHGFNNHKNMECILRFKLIFKIKFVITNVMFLPKGQFYQKKKKIPPPPPPPHKRVR
jgi:hypothetical protein